MKKTYASATIGGTVLSRYQDLIVGSRSLGILMYYEWCMLMSNIPGSIGLFIRKLFWPCLFEACGKGVQFGSGIILRHPHRIKLGNHVIVSEGCILDARNEEQENVINIGSDVVLSNNVMLSCKKGTVTIGDRSGLNAQTIIQSVDCNPVVIGSDVVIGPRCYIVGGSNYKTDRLDIQICRQGMKKDGGVIIENDVWLGYNVMVMGGVRIQSGSIAAAGSIITKSIPPRTVSAGQPAKIIKYRD